MKYAVVVGTAQKGSIVRVVDSRTGDCIVVGGFEGLQRYLTRSQIRIQKITAICLSSCWEVPAYISIKLTQNMGGNPFSPQILMPSRLTQVVSSINTAIGATDAASLVQPGSTPAIETAEAESSPVVLGNGAQIHAQVFAGYTVFFIKLPPIKGRFRRDRAREAGVVDKSKLIQLAKGMKVDVSGQIFHPEDYYDPAPALPTVIIITLISSQARITDIDMPRGTAEVFIRMGAETETENEVETLKRAKKAVETMLEKKKAGSPIRLVLRTETPHEDTEAFYSRMTAACKDIAHPLLFQPSTPSYTTVSAEEYMTDGDYLRLPEGLLCRSRAEKSSRCGYNCGYDCPPEKSTGLMQIPSKTPKESPRRESKRICFLGTGAAFPGIYRNVSSLMFSGISSDYLLDCGEDTSTQLSKMSRAYLHDYSNLRLVFLSHRHADHVLGVISVLHAAVRSGNTTVIVLGHASIRPMLEEFGVSCILIPVSKDLYITEQSRHEGRDCLISSILVQRKSRGSEVFLEVEKQGANGQNKKESKICVMNLTGHSNAPDLVSLIGNPAVETAVSSQYPIPGSLGSEQGTTGFALGFCEALHIPDSYSISVTDHSDGIETRLTYSGDTLPNPAFALLSSDADVMVHEGTFNDEHKEKAAQTGHSTISDALEVFRASRAKQLYVTHISQRYKHVQIPVGVFAMDYLACEVPGACDQTQLQEEMKKWAEEKRDNGQHYKEDRHHTGA